MLITRYLSRAKGLEIRVLLIWFSIVGALWVFLALGNEIGEGETGALDQQLIGLLRTSSNGSVPIGPAWFKESMRDVTALGGFTFLSLTTIVVVMSLLLHQRRREGVFIAATAICSQTSIEILKFLYGRPRPAPLLQPLASTDSFPSGHTAESTAIFLTVATVIASLEVNDGTKILAYAVAIFVMMSVGFSRVYLGMHWPTDVLGGWVLGTAWALVAWTALRRR